MSLPKSSNQAQLAYTEIKAKVLAGFFPVNERLRESDISAAIGLGRTPVREALKRLLDERLLTYEQSRGLAVTSMDQQNVVELYAMREILEAAAASFATQHATEAEIANMQAIIDESRSSDCDPVALNLAFHQAVYSAAHNRHLIHAVQALMDTTYLLGRSTLDSKARAGEAAIEHQAILDAIRAGKTAAAGDCARQHIHNALLERLKILRTPRPIDEPPLSEAQI